MRLQLTLLGVLFLLLTPNFVHSTSEKYIQNKEITQHQVSEIWSDQVHWNVNNVNAPRAWELTTGTPEAIVAIIDTGVDYNHPELNSSIWTNEDEIPNNGIDDDTNGYVDDTIGWDFVDNDNDPYDKIGYSAGHGTHVAGTIAAPFNDYGLVGIAPDVSIMPLRVIGESIDFSYQESVSNAIQYAVDNGAKVISMSLEFSPDAAFYNALESAKNNDVILVAAAGNGNTNVISYPASDGSVIAVAAVDKNNIRAGFSNFGPVIDITAPGVNVNSTTNSDYATSVALEINGIRTLAYDVRNSKTTDTSPIEGDIIYLEANGNYVGDLSGKIPLVTRVVNDTLNQEIIANVSSQGAIGVIFADFTTSYVRPIVLNSKSIVPAVSIFTNIAKVLIEELMGNETLIASLNVRQTNFQLWSGTSMATPHVSAAAALMYSLNSSLTDEEVKFILERSATDLGEKGWDQFFGNGLLDIQAALVTTIDTVDPELELNVTYDESNKIATLNLKASDDTYTYGYGYLFSVSGENVYSGSIVNPEKSRVFTNRLEFILSDLEASNILYITVEDYRGHRKNYQFDLISLIFNSAHSTSTKTTTEYPIATIFYSSLLLLSLRVKKFRK
ncbi:MAG: S8 family serine peptidase [Candidatus Kariarchaeaceae archaeon]